MEFNFGTKYLKGKMLFIRFLKTNSHVAFLDYENCSFRSDFKVSYYERYVTQLSIFFNVFIFLYIIYTTIILLNRGVKLCL